MRTAWPGTAGTPFKGGFAIAGLAAVFLAALLALFPSALLVTALLIGVLFGVLIFGHSVELFVLGLLLIRASLDTVGGGGAVTPSSLVGIVVIGTTVVWLALRPRTVKHPGSRLQVALLFYAAAAGLSIFVSLRPSTSAVEFIRFVSAVCIFLLVDRLIASGASERRLLLVVLASAVIPLAVAGFDVVTSGTIESKGDFDRLSSTFAQSNGFSRYLMVLIIMGLATLGLWRSRLLRAVILCGCAAGGAALVLTYTRASWIGAAIGVAIVIFYNRRYRVPAAATALVVLLIASPALVSRFADLGGSDQGIAAISSSNSLEWRINYWNDVIDLADDSPINGIGLGTTAQVTDQEKQPHSELIRAYVELGVVGLVAYALMLGALLHTALVAMRSTSGHARSFSIGYFASVVSFALVTLVTNALSQTALLWYVFALSAIALSVSRRGATTLSDGPPLPTSLHSQWAFAEDRPALPVHGR